MRHPPVHARLQRGRRRVPAARARERRGDVGGRLSAARSARARGGARGRRLAVEARRHARRGAARPAPGAADDPGGLAVRADAHPVLHGQGRRRQDLAGLRDRRAAGRSRAPRAARLDRSGLEPRRSARHAASSGRPTRSRARRACPRSTSIRSRRPTPTASASSAPIAACCRRRPSRASKSSSPAPARGDRGVRRVHAPARPDATWDAWDHVVFDTAPTGHTLRLLELPAAWYDVHRHDTTGTSCLGPLSGLKAQHATYKASLAALRDAERTTIVLVARPDASRSPRPSARAANSRSSASHDHRLVVNGVFEAGDPDDAIAAALEARGRAALDAMPAGARQLPRVDVPLLPWAPLGARLRFGGCSMPAARRPRRWRTRPAVRRSSPPRWRRSSRRSPPRRGRRADDGQGRRRQDDDGGGDRARARAPRPPCAPEHHRSGGARRPDLAGERRRRHRQPHRSGGRDARATRTRCSPPPRRSTRGAAPCSRKTCARRARRRSRCSAPSRAPWRVETTASSSSTRRRPGTRCCCSTRPRPTTARWRARGATCRTPCGSCCRACATARSRASCSSRCPRPRRCTRRPPPGRSAARRHRAVRVGRQPELRGPPDTDPVLRQRAALEQPFLDEVRQARATRVP